MKTITYLDYQNLSDKECRSFTGIVEFASGTKYWFKRGLLHRLDGPAVISKDELTKEYYINGIIHSCDTWQVARMDYIKKSKEFQNILKYKGLT